MLLRSLVVGAGKGPATAMQGVYRSQVVPTTDCPMMTIKRNSIQKNVVGSHLRDRMNRSFRFLGSVTVTGGKFRMVNARRPDTKHLPMFQTSRNTQNLCGARPRHSRSRVTPNKWYHIWYLPLEHLLLGLTVNTDCWKHWIHRHLDWNDKSRLESFR